MKFNIDDNLVIEGHLFKFFNVKTDNGLMELTPKDLIQNVFLDTGADPGTFYTAVENLDGEKAIIVVHQEEDGFEWFAHKIQVINQDF